jgi:superoxide dismutase, Fe-Mn family
MTLHEMGNVAGFEPVLVMDVWEHELLLDHQPAQWAKYIEVFFANIDWQAVEGRLQTGY